MAGLTPAHLLIILIIALVVIGPGKLPEVGAAIGKSLREFQKATGQVQDAPPPAQPVPAVPVQQAGQPMQATPPAQSYYAAQPAYPAPAYPQQPAYPVAQTYPGQYAPVQYGAPAYPPQHTPADPAAAAPLPLAGVVEQPAADTGNH